MYYLKTLLEREGMVVMMTRNGIGKGAYRENFFDWLRARPELWSEKNSLSSLFCGHYNILDLYARVEKIRDFKPDISVIIHYNSHCPGEGLLSNHHPTAQNYNMVFIPGAFCSKELDSERSRYEFIRLLISDDLAQSQKLGKALLGAFCRFLKVPPVTEEDGARYLSRTCIEIEPGIFSRNLALTRLVHGPVAYCETLIQNNDEECLSLGRKDITIDGVCCSSRIKEVAEAYFEGIIDYLLH